MKWIKVNKNNMPEVGESVLIRLARRPYRKGDGYLVIAYRNHHNEWFTTWLNNSIGGKPTHFTRVKF